MGGRDAHALFDRSKPGKASITVRFSKVPGDPLPEFARGREALVIAGSEVPVQAVNLECGAGALRGSLNPALVEAVAGPAAPAGPAQDAPAPVPVPAPAPGPGAGDPPLSPPAPADSDRAAGRLAAFRDAKAALAKAGESIAGARERAARLQREAEAAARELADLEGSLDSLRSARADAGQALLDAVAAEVEEA